MMMPFVGLLLNSFDGDALCRSLAPMMLLLLLDANTMGWQLFSKWKDSHAVDIASTDDDAGCWVAVEFIGSTSLSVMAMLFDGEGIDSLRR